MLELDKRINFAFEMASIAAVEIEQSNLYDLNTEFKNDGSFVTELDQRVELKLRDILEKAFPEDGILAEEFAHLDKEGNDWKWTIDPIDGTSSLAYGMPFFGPLIGLMHKGVPVFGLADFPLIRERAWGIKGAGAYWKHPYSEDPVKLDRTRQTKSLADALYSHSGTEYFHHIHDQKLHSFLQESCLRERTWGDAFGHIAVATGRLDLQVDPVLFPWDYVPLKVIIDESGAIMMDKFGEKEDITGESAITCVPGIETEVFELIQKVKGPETGPLHV